jgi:dethiobiotin synthetase
LLTAEAIARDGLPLAGWVGNCANGEMDEQAANIATLNSLLPAPCLGIVPHLEQALPEQVADYLTLPA